MSKIIATDHFETQNWEVTFEDLAPTYADLFIGFNFSTPTISKTTNVTGRVFHNSGTKGF
jgi:hypothetical protein